MTMFGTLDVARNSRKDDRGAPTVLVVDDELNVREMLVRWLADAGYTCRHAADAEQAWGVLGRVNVGLVTLDITLPGRSGLEILPDIRRTYPEAEVIMLTALGDSRTAIAALTMGASGYLIKPIEREDLLFQVRRGLERRQLLIEKRRYTEILEQRVLEQTLEIRQAHEETICRLAAATNCRDEETGAHIRRTGLFSAALASAAGWTKSEVECIRMAAPMHDIGKIAVPDGILQKPGKLTDAEYEMMKRHTVVGANVLTGSSSRILQLACQIARSHHERWDGQGYPDGLSGDNIPECARIVSIVDVYDALTHDRVYRPAMPEAAALNLMQAGQGTQFDPLLLPLFFSILPDIQRINAETQDAQCIADDSQVERLRSRGLPALIENVAT